MNMEKTLVPYFCLLLQHCKGYAMAQLVEALRYNPKGREFDSRWCHCSFY